MILGTASEDSLLDEHESHLFFSTTEELTYNTSRGTITIPKSTPFITEPLKVYSVSDVALMVLAIVSTIGALFDVLSYFKQ